MTNEQLYLALGIPVVVNIGLYLALRSDIKELRTELNANIKRVETELRLEIATLRDMLIGKVIEHGERITKLETKR